MNKIHQHHVENVYFSQATINKNCKFILSNLLDYKYYKYVSTYSREIIKNIGIFFKFNME